MCVAVHCPSVVVVMRVIAVMGMSMRHKQTLMISPNVWRPKTPCEPRAPSTAYRNYRASLARGKLLFLRALSFW